MLLQYLTPCSLDDQADEEQGEGIVLGGGPRYPWEGTDRDYKYEEVLNYFFLQILFVFLLNMDLCTLVINKRLFDSLSAEYVRQLSRALHPW